MKRLVLLAAVLAAGCGDPPRQGPADQAGRLNASGSAALEAGRPRAAAARFAAAAELSAATDDRAGLSRDLHNRGLALAAAGELAAARADLLESVRLADAAGIAARERAQSLLALATVQAALGQTDAALGSVGRACSDAEQASERNLRARAYASRAALALRRGDLDAATRDLAQAAPLADGDPASAAAVAVNQGHLAVLRGDAAAARSRYASAVDGFRIAGDAGGLAAALEGSARAAEAAGDRAGAAADWRRAAAVPHGGESARQRRLEHAARLDR